MTVCSRSALALALLAVPSSAASDVRLIESIREQGGRTVSDLLKDKADVNATQSDGATPLAWAAYLDQAGTVSLLLKNGANPNSADEYGETPLTLACATGDFTIIEQLITAGADATATRWNGESALMIASRSGNLDAVKLLLAHGANINATDTRKGQSALMWAAAEGHSEIVDFLLKNNASPKAVSSGGFTPLVFATQKGDAKSVKSLLDAGLSPNYKLSNGMDVLEVAVLGEKPAVVDVLLEKGALPTAADQSGTTALHLAAQSGNVHIAKALLAKGADPNAVTNKIAARGGRNFFRSPVGEQSPLFFAARANHKDVMELLVAAGANPKLKAQDGSTLLMAAAGSGHFAPVEYAFSLDPDVTSVTTRKSTVMHAAVSLQLQKTTQAEVCKVIKFLADKGADLDSLDATGRTPIAVANVLPIDNAVTLLSDLITATGKTPQISASR